MNWFRILRIAGKNIDACLGYALTSNPAYLSAKNIKPQHITT